MVVVEGADAQTYLHTQVSQDLNGMTVGEQRWTFVLEPTGKIDGLARVTRVADERFELDTDAGFGEALLARIDRFKIRVAADTSLGAQVGEPADEAERVAVGWPRLGAEIIPAWARLTRSTSSACCSTDRLRWSTPMPPARAIAIASGASVTVSIAADMRGTRSSIPASEVVVSTSDGNTSLQPGTTSKSSKVSASAPAKISSFIRPR